MIVTRYTLYAPASQHQSIKVQEDDTMLTMSARSVQMAWEVVRRRVPRATLQAQKTWKISFVFLSHNLIMIFIIILLRIIWLIDGALETDMIISHRSCLPWVNGLWIKTWRNSFRPPSLMFINRPQASLLTQASSMSSSCTGVFTAEVSAYLVENMFNTSCCGLHVHLRSERCHESRPLLFIN